MFGRRKDLAPVQDPLVAPIESLLSAGATPMGTRDLQMNPRPTAEYAMWICACFNLDDAPTWLIYETPGGAVTWSRVLGRTEPLDLVEARFSAGGHADTRDVLDWLQGDVAHPWTGGHGWGDEGVVERLGERIRRE